MPENLKDLLERINQEGIKQAEENAKEIESRARSDAEKIVGETKKLSEGIIQGAKAEAEKMRASGELALKQASRDLLLSLKDEIRKIFNNIITAELSKIMTQEEIADILKELILRYADKGDQVSDIKVLVKKEDLEKIRHVFLAKLKDKVKDGVEFRPSDNINTGFSISFDKGKSYFDFTDEGLLETLCVYLNPELAKIIA